MCGGISTMSGRQPVLRSKEALDRIGALYDIERRITGASSEQLARLPGKGELAKAMRYALNRWPAFTRFLEDGRGAIDNNVAERAIRPVVIGRKNFLFAGSDAGGEIIVTGRSGPGIKSCSRDV
jgi:hypothetical protein